MPRFNKFVPWVNYLISDNGEAFIFDREVVVLIKPKIRVLDRFKAKDLKIKSFVKIGFVRCSSGHTP